MTGQRLLVLRHRESTWNAEGRWAGQADPPLSTVGRADAARVARGLEDVEFSAVVTSDLQRAAETAKAIVSKRPGAELLVDARLREHHVPMWEGRTKAEIDALGLGSSDGPSDGRRARADIEGAEPWVAFEARVVESLISVPLRHRVVVVVAHSGVLRVLMTVAGAPARPTRSQGIWIEHHDGRLLAGAMQRVRGSSGAGPERQPG